MKTIVASVVSTLLIVGLCVAGFVGYNTAVSEAGKSGFTAGQKAVADAARKAMEAGQAISFDDGLSCVATCKAAPKAAGPLAK